MLDGFRGGLEGCDLDWVSVGRKLLPAANFLDKLTLDLSSPIDELLDLTRQHKDRLLWEQSYSKRDKVVDDAMLAGYAFTELTGKLGPFISNRLRCGIGIWGPGITYPLHWHEAEEIYWILSGTARYCIEQDDPVLQRPSDIIYIPSNTPHGFSTEDEPFIVLYLWQGADLRQISEFS